MELTTRQVCRLVARLREHGPAGLVSGHRSKPGNRSLDSGAADRALSIIRARYADLARRIKPDTRPLPPASGTAPASRTGSAPDGRHH
ncbi:hypothetical protein [Burkholderia cepacia]|uniref:hypothetical protein n=1 Tax=Burkholderia cepacia TaxID=292 RepID=UPI0022AB3289|nr:hypothetical protein [Burkholderia cepacia]